MPVLNLIIWLEDDAKGDRVVIEAISDDFETTLGDDSWVRRAYQEKESKENVLKIMDVIFYVVIGIIMFLSLFSLLASMTANIFS